MLSWRRQVYRWLEQDDSLIGRWVNISMTTLNLLNVIAVMIESMHDAYLAYGTAIR